MNREYTKSNEEAPINQIFRGLTDIYKRLCSIPFFSTDTITAVTISEIKDTLKVLETVAKSSGDQPKEKLLATLFLKFYRLETTGVVDDPKRFSTEASSLLDTIEAVLLMGDNGGEILKMIEERGSRY